MPLTKKAKRSKNLGEHSKRKAERGPVELSLPPTQHPLPAPANPLDIPPDSPETSESIGTPSAMDISSGIPTLNPSRPPPHELVKQAIPILDARISPRRKSGVGHMPSKLNALALKDLTSVLELFNIYCTGGITWTQASINISQAKGYHKAHARTLRMWAHACITDPEFIPRKSYGLNHNPLIKNDDFRKQLEEHLRKVGKYVITTDVIRFTAQPEVLEKWGLTKAVSKSTATRWMRVLDYRWGKAPKGMYIDGHERQDVVNYRQNTYIPTWKGIEPRMESFARFDSETRLHMDPIIRKLVAWWHDESIFRANDERLVTWVPSSATPKPTRKGDGPTLMVSDLVSAKYGWLASPDGQEQARVFFQPGTNCEGYFNSSRVCKQIEGATEILAKYFPEEDHIIIFNNSPTHTKRGLGAPSAQGMPKKTPKKGNFLVTTTDEDGNTIKVPMTGAYFANGEPQELYWPEGHPKAGLFKGMAQILKERGWENAEKIRGKCARCDQARTNCCLYRILYNQPDFANPTSILERLVRSRGYGFLLLPKFHPELNPIEQCWGKAKQAFRKMPHASGIKQLEKNVKAALESVSLEDIQRFCMRCWRICDGYAKGLDGRLSIWAAKKYHGHREYPRKILEEAIDAIGESLN